MEGQLALIVSTLLRHAETQVWAAAGGTRLSSHVRPRENDMPLKSSAFAAAAAVALIGAAAILEATPASASCRGTVEAFSRGLFQDPSQIVARARWRSEVRRRYGFSFARWASAREKVERCTKEKSGRRWHCIARARPCNS